jgi:hypothetical protein
MSYIKYASVKRKAIRNRGIFPAWISSIVVISNIANRIPEVITEYLNN